MGKVYTTTIPLWILDGSDGEFEVAFGFNPGTPETGTHNCPPEDYDPGSGDEFWIEGSWYLSDDGKRIGVLGLADHESERVVEYLDDEWERPDDGPDPDDVRDRLIDDRLTGILGD